MRKVLLPVALLMATVGTAAVLVEPDRGQMARGGARRAVGSGFEVLDLRANGALRLASALEPFASCDEMLGQLKEQASRGHIALSPEFSVRAAGDVAMSDFSAQASSGAEGDSGPATPMAPKSASPSPQAGKDFSGTNVQEQGVDEPDLVKTDGDVLFTLTSGVLRAFDVRGDTPVELSELRVDGARELFIAGDKALVIGSLMNRSSNEPVPTDDAQIGIVEPRPQQVHLVEVDVRDPKAMKQVASLKVDGSYTTARLIGDKARVVIQSSMPARLPAAHVIGQGDEDAWRKARDKSAELLEGSGVDQWLPHYDYERGAAQETGPIAPCTKIQQPPEQAGPGTTSVVTVDLATGLRPGTPTTVAGAAQVVYASSESLYVAASAWGQIALDDPVGFTTAIHKLDLTGEGEARYVASGRVPGHILNQFSLSEHEGHLRVAVTEPQTRADVVSESAVVTVKQDGDALVPVGSVGGLGKGERIYAVRFFGDVGYVVTFRQTDPLYTVDLSDPTKPAVLGELKIPGYSAYLHPIGDGLVIGIGQDATDEGRRTGAQLSLFDVSDLRDPQRLARAGITDGQGVSRVEQDHRAFLWWDQTRTVAVPFLSYDNVRATSLAGVVGFEVGAKAAPGLRRIGTVSHRSGQRGIFAIERSLVMRDALLTVSRSGLMASDLVTFAERAWLPFCDVAVNQVYEGPVDGKADRPSTC